MIFVIVRDHRRMVDQSNLLGQPGKEMKSRRISFRMD